MLTDTDVKFAIQKVAKKVRWLVRREWLRRDDAEDFSQDLLHDIVASFRVYDPARATREGYITEIVSRRWKSHLRDLWAAKRRFGTASGIAGLGYDTIDARAEAERDLLDYRVDLDEVLERLPETLAAICEGLRTYGEGECARRMGVHRCKVQYAVRRAQAEAKKTRRDPAADSSSRALAAKEMDEGTV